MPDKTITTPLAQIKDDHAFYDWFVWYTPLMGSKGWHIINKFQYGDCKDLDECPAVGIVYPENIND